MRANTGIHRLLRSESWKSEIALQGGKVRLLPIYVRYACMNSCCLGFLIACLLADFSLAVVQCSGMYLFYIDLKESGVAGYFCSEFCTYFIIL